jgi:hypothetical protein
METESIWKKKCEELQLKLESTEETLKQERETKKTLLSLKSDVENSETILKSQRESNIKQLNELKEKHGRDLTDLQRDFEKRLSEMNDQNNRSIRETSAANDKKKRELEEQWLLEQQTLIKENKLHRTKIEEEHQLELEELTSALKQQAIEWEIKLRKELTSDQEKEKSMMIENHKKIISELFARQKAEKELLELQHFSAIQNMKESFELEQTELTNEKKKMLSIKENQFTEQLTRLQQQSDEKQQMFTVELNQKSQEHQAILQKKEKELQEELQTMQTRFELQKQHLQQDLESRKQRLDIQEKLVNELELKKTFQKIQSQEEIQEAKEPQDERSESATTEKQEDILHSNPPISSKTTKTRQEGHKEAFDFKKYSKHINLSKPTIKRRRSHLSRVDSELSSSLGLPADDSCKLFIQNSITSILISFFTHSTAHDSSEINQDSSSSPSFSESESENAFLETISNTAYLSRVNERKVPSRCKYLLKANDNSPNCILFHSAHFEKLIESKLNSEKHYLSQAKKFLKQAENQMFDDSSDKDQEVDVAHKTYADTTSWATKDNAPLQEIKARLLMAEQKLSALDTSTRIRENINSEHNFKDKVFIFFFNCPSFESYIQHALAGIVIPLFGYWQGSSVYVRADKAP